MIPIWLRPVVLNRDGPKYMHKYFDINGCNISNWMRWSRLRLIQTEIHATAALQQPLDKIDRWTSVLRELLEEFCSGLAFMLMPFNETEDLQDQNWNSSDLVRGIKGYFLVRVLAATAMNFRVLERLGAEMRDREAWFELFRTVVKFEIGMGPIATPDPMDIPWELPGFESDEWTP